MRTGAYLAKKNLLVFHLDQFASYIREEDGMKGTSRESEVLKHKIVRILGEFEEDRSGVDSRQRFVRAMNTQKGLGTSAGDFVFVLTGFERISLHEVGHGDPLHKPV
eukprot:gene16898-23174_t